MSFGTLCSMFDVLVVGTPNQFVSICTLCSMFDVLAVCVPKLLVPVGTLMFHNGYMTYCVFDRFTEPLPEESSTGGSGKNQMICRLETGLHFLGNTKCLTTSLLRNEITSAVSVSWTRHSHRDLFIGGNGGRGGGLLLACVPCGVWCGSERSLFCLLINTRNDFV